MLEGHTKLLSLLQSLPASVFSHFLSHSLTSGIFFFFFQVRKQFELFSLLFD